jgi:hypothetical protein
VNAILTIVAAVVSLMTLAAHPTWAQSTTAPAGNDPRGPIAVREPSGAISFYTNSHGVRSRAFCITPEGSLLAGGVSTAKTPLTNVPPVMDPLLYDNDKGGDRRNWIHDFYFGRYETPGEGQPRLHVRGLIMWGRGDSPDIQLGRTGPDNAPTAYGPPEDTAPGTSLGKLIFTAWGGGQFQGDIAGMYARNDTVPTGKKNPGSLHLGTAGESEKGNAWRDMIDRLVIRSNGFVGIGDELSNPSERLHVGGNVRVDGNITASGEIISKKSPRVEIKPDTGDGQSIAHAALIGPGETLFYRGQSQLANGRAVVELPAYFESIARKEGRTVLLTNLDGFDRIAIERQSASQVKDGRFVVVAQSSSSSQAFSWEVKALRQEK